MDKSTPNLILVIFAGFMIAACSSETTKRTVYESLESKRIADCQRDLTAPCEKRKNYDEYKRERTQDK